SCSPSLRPTQHSTASACAAASLHSPNSSSASLRSACAAEPGRRSSILGSAFLEGGCQLFHDAGIVGDKLDGLLAVGGDDRKLGIEEGAPELHREALAVDLAVQRSPDRVNVVGPHARNPFVDDIHARNGIKTALVAL